MNMQNTTEKIKVWRASYIGHLGVIEILVSTTVLKISRTSICGPDRH